VDVFECRWARSLYLNPNEPFKALELVAYAMHLRMYGERAPGGRENWKDWDIVAEDYLRAMNDLGEK
jgi:hypothetical protein